MFLLGDGIVTRGQRCVCPDEDFEFIDGTLIGLAGPLAPGWQ